MRLVPSIPWEWALLRTGLGLSRAVPWVLCAEFDWRLFPCLSVVSLFRRLSTMEERRDWCCGIGGGCSAAPLSMKLLVWNCQGLGSHWTVRVLSELIRFHNPALVFLSETKCKKRKYELLKEKHNIFGVSVDSRSKGVFDGKGMDGWRFTGIYGQPDAARHEETWRLLRKLSQLSPRPWLCGGDFNEILCQTEKTGLASSGKLKILDPVFLTAARGSDHNPLIINLEAGTGHSQLRRWKMIRFEAMSTRSDDCEAIVREQWCSTVEGDVRSRILQRTRRVREGHIGWDKTVFGHVRKRMKELEEKLAAVANDPINVADKTKRRSLWSELEEFLSRRYMVPFSRRYPTDCYYLFHNLFRTSNPSTEAIDKILRGMPRKVSEEMNEALIQSFSPEEKYWHIVGPEITSFVLEFLNHGRFDGKLNYTFVVLIPKCDSPESMSHLRPISLCNISFKIASKMLANRLKPILHYIVSESQSAFIPGRLTIDNVLVAYELNHYLAHKTWGSKFGYLHPQRGLRKGDLPSSYLFLFCAEAFSHLVFTAEANGEIQGVSISRHGPRVSHLLFANDTFIFCQATQDAMNCVEQIWQVFEEASGLMVNLEKSSIAFSRNTSIDLQADLANILGAMPMFVMGCFLVPTTICRELEGMMADFLWHNKESKRVHCLSWDKLCARKEEGGLGLQNLGAFNQAMLAKELWRIITNPNALLSQLLKHKYFPNSDMLQATVGPGCSFTWHSILAVIIASNTLHEDTTVDRLVDATGEWNDNWFVRFFDLRIWGEGVVPHLQFGPAGSKSYKTEDWSFIWHAVVPPKVPAFGVGRKRRNYYMFFYAVILLVSFGRCPTSLGRQFPVIAFRELPCSAAELIDRVRGLESSLSLNGQFVLALEDSIKKLQVVPFNPVSIG
ncbi:UNVERIFIED_CONTAM: putative mitochondrial protein [Sesamum latifolium]|uniref:Mitochondrial protein n=1 Tax=Sesamum latifolium TaxID=2727402 RepID=A0AAW2TM60_9LAMI